MTSKLIRPGNRFFSSSRPPIRRTNFCNRLQRPPELIEDFTSSVEDIEARLATVRSGHRTALLDAIYYGVAKMKDARHERKALLVVSDGAIIARATPKARCGRRCGRRTWRFIRSASSIRIAPRPRSAPGPQLLEDISDVTGGRLVSGGRCRRLGDIAEKISTELRNQYVIG